MSRFDRYLIKEVMLTFFAAVVVLLAMVVSQRLASLLSAAASGRLARDAIFVLLGLRIVRYLVILMPAAFLLGAMLALGRMYRDNEMTALTACGVGPKLIYRPLLMLAAPMAVVLAVLSLYVAPQAMALYYELQAQARQNAAVSMFVPGRFQEADEGRHVIYVGQVIDGGQELRDIFIQSLLPGEIGVTTAERGHQEIDPGTGSRYVVLEDGHRYEGFPGRGDYRSAHFERMKIRIETEPDESARIRSEAMPTAVLAQSTALRDIAELHQRISGAIAMLLLALLAPLLARAKPREGRYGRVVAAVLVYTIYINLLGVGGAWIEKGIVWPGLGLWWVHALLAALVLGLALYQYGTDILPFKAALSGSYHRRPA